MAIAAILSTLFSEFDEAVIAHKLYKVLVGIEMMCRGQLRLTDCHQVDTIGDCYIVVAFLEDWSGSLPTKAAAAFKWSGHFFGMSGSSLRVAPTRHDDSMTIDRVEESPRQSVGDVAGWEDSHPTNGASVCALARVHVSGCVRTCTSSGISKGAGTAAGEPVLPSLPFPLLRPPVSSPIPCEGGSQIVGYAAHAVLFLPSPPPFSPLLSMIQTQRGSCVQRCYGLLRKW